MEKLHSSFWQRHQRHPSIMPKCVIMMLDHVHVPTSTCLTFVVCSPVCPKPNTSQYHTHVIPSCALHLQNNSSPSTPTTNTLSRRSFLRFYSTVPLALPFMIHSSSTSRTYNYDKETASVYETLDGTTPLTRTLGLDTLRAQLLSQASGDTLELGFGTGVNIPFYNDNNLNNSKIKSLTVVDKSIDMLNYAKDKETKYDVTSIVGDASKTNFPSDSFDTVVLTFCLCVVSDVSDVINEVHRLTKKNGRVLVLDYTKSKQFQPIALYQDLTADIVTKMSKGCKPNLDLNSIFEDNRFSIISSTSILAGTITAFQLSPIK